MFRPDNSVQMLEVGASISWNASSFGKAIVANLDPEGRKDLLGGPFKALTGKTLTIAHGVEADLKRIERVGFAVEDVEGQEAIVGEAGIASAVFDYRGGVVGAIGVSGPTERLLPKGLESSIIVLVKEAARGLSREMGAGRASARAARGG